MNSWEALPAVRLLEAGTVCDAFQALGVDDFRSAGRFVCDLAYGRNSSNSDQLAVLHERRGTCSTKHALLARLSAEQRLPMNLMLGIYLMDDRNTPGVGAVLARHGLETIPEAHCYLRLAADRIDVTRNITSAEPIDDILYEEAIAPEEIHDYKIALHQRFLRDWLGRTPELRGFTLDRMWQVREECIRALST